MKDKNFKNDMIRTYFFTWGRVQEQHGG
jgi:hypothetical protein